MASINFDPVAHRLQTLAAALGTDGPLEPLTDYAQFITYALIPTADGFDKVPVDRMGNHIDPHDPRNWSDVNTALNTAYAYKLHVGFVLTANDPFWCVDIDGCVSEAGYDARVQTAEALFPGAGIEHSVSGTGVHLWGRGAVPEHRKKTESYELYTDSRFIALTGAQARGWAGRDFTGNMQVFVANYMKPLARAEYVQADGPCDEWEGPADDNELFGLMLKAEPAQTVPTTADDGLPNVHVGDLLYGNLAVLAARYPVHKPRADGLPYDASRADMALARKLAYWTGRDVQRIERMMRQAAIRRPKYDKRDYLARTVAEAAGAVTSVYGEYRIDPAMVERGRQLVAGLLAKRNPDGTERPNSFQLTLERADEPMKPDVVKGIIPDAEFGAIYGAPGAGKSFMALELGYHIAQGIEWRGRKVKQRPVFYIAAEGADGVRRRAKAFAISHSVAKGTPFYSREESVVLNSPESCAQVAADINSLRGDRAGVIFVDTMSRAIAGVEENSAAEMSKVVDAATKLGKDTGCIVIMVAHSNSAGEIRGSTAVSGAAYFSLHVARDPEDRKLRTLTVKKLKDGEDGQQLHFTLKSVHVGKDMDGDDVYSAVTVPCGENGHIEMPDGTVQVNAPEQKRKEKPPVDPVEKLKDRARIMYDTIVELVRTDPVNNVHPTHPLVHWTKVELIAKQKFLGIGVHSKHATTRIGEALAALISKNLVQQHFVSEHERYYFVQSIPYDSSVHEMPLTN